MEDVKYQVFISSTYNDLIEERRRVLDVLLMADCIPAGMEAFVATDLEQFEVIKKVIDLCDYYVLIIGKRYGSISQETGISYTEMEYDYAIAKGIPVLVFAIDEGVDLPDDKKENNQQKIEKLKKFREKAMKNRMASIWSTIDELTGCLAISIMKAKNEIKRLGWQRAVDYDEASLRRQIMELQIKNEELNQVLTETQGRLNSLIEQSDLAFEDCSIHFKYYYYNNTYGTHTQKVNKSKDILLIDVFKVISLEMLDVSLKESAIENALISKLFDKGKSIYWYDSQIVKQILMQLSELGLIYSNWNKDKAALFWGLTEKGKKIRNDLLLMHKKNYDVETSENKDESAE